MEDTYVYKIVFENFLGVRSKRSKKYTTVNKLKVGELYFIHGKPYRILELLEIWDW